MDTQTIMDLEQQYIVQTYRRSPFVLERGEGVYLYDTEGRLYLDFVAGIAVNALGYGDPEMLAAIQDQASKLIHISNLYHMIPHVRLAQRLVEHSFADRVFFCNSGTEANEAAIKFARKWARANFGEGKTKIVAFSSGFHGRTMGSLALTPRDKYQKPFAPLMPDVAIAKFNDLESAEEAVDDATCAVFVEPLQGEGGVNPASHDFLRGLRRLCDAHNALLIFDEIQCGLGRTGTLWGHELSGVTPDIMCLAKPLGGGLPMGATLVTEEVGQVLGPGDHGSTFAANCVIAAVACVVFDRISDEEFLAGVRAKGEYLRERLVALQGEVPITEVRGRGLMWGLETPLASSDIVSAGYKEGIIVASAGDHVVRLVPPLIIERAHIDELIPALRRAFQRAQEGI
ncbi:MAG: aspartate aminotransferase family protein [Chloroflexota bacterium]|nr:aspartate aminotransferase family protein [Chloroflexota bacterium]